jgi:hypothetical protein
MKRVEYHGRALLLSLAFSAHHQETIDPSSLLNLPPLEELLPQPANLTRVEAAILLLNQRAALDIVHRYITQHPAYTALQHSPKTHKIARFRANEWGRRFTEHCETKLAGTEYADLANADRDAFVHWMELREVEDDSSEEKSICEVYQCSIPIRH